MSDTAYQNALRRKKELQEELKRIEDFLRLYAEFAGEEEAAQPKQPKKAFMVPRADQKGAVADAYINPSREEVGRYAKEFMLKSGTPKTRGAILAYLEQVGRPIKGKDPSKNIGTIMWRLKDEFVNVEGHGYWPKGVALPDDIQKELDKKAEIEELIG